MAAVPRSVSFPPKTQPGFGEASAGPHTPTSGGTALPFPVQESVVGVLTPSWHHHSLVASGVMARQSAPAGSPRGQRSPGAIPGPRGRCGARGRQAGGGPASFVPNFLAVARLLALPVGGDASGSPLGRQPARGGRRREDKAGRRRRGSGSRLGQGRRVPGPKAGSTGRHEGALLRARGSGGRLIARAPPMRARPPATYPASR